MKSISISKVILLCVILIILMVFYSLDDEQEKPLKELHKTALQNSPFTNTGILSKKERYEKGLPPNRYNEESFELTMNPRFGRPTPENLQKIKDDLSIHRSTTRGVGDNSNPWVDRGPNNQGGRTRGIMFDPTDTIDYNRVFAGGVSGGLWINDDITNANSSWRIVDGIDGSLAVSVITYDVNNPNIFYVGTGESYTSGDAVGSGIWKSTDAGKNWQKIMGGYEGINGINVEGIFYINDLQTRNNNGQTEIFAAVSSAIYRYSSGPTQGMGMESLGIYKSVDGGTNWTRMDIKRSNGSYKNPNDIEVDINNNVWVTTTRGIDGSAGGDIYKSTDGLNFELVNTIPGARRTEIEISSNDPNQVWVIADVNSQADFFKSTDGFITFSEMNEPEDPDGGIPSTDFTRGQAFYNLEIEADSNDNLIVGGINLFRSTDKGETWDIISKWANTAQLAPLSIPLVHGDQHAIVFRPGSDSKLALGNDGGIYYSDNILNAGFSEEAITERNKDYNTIQFYSGAIETSDDTEDNFSGGSQDNGTQLNTAANSGTNPFVDPFGGDGGYTEIDGEDGYMIQSYYYNDHRIINYPQISESDKISTLSNDGVTNGNFINVAELDKNFDIFYANASHGNNYRIEKVSNFKLDAANLEAQFIAHPALESRPSALKASKFAIDSPILYVGTRTGQLFKIFFEGSSNIWTDITGPDFVGSISDIEQGTNEDEIFITFHNYGVTSVWFSADAGLSWSNLEGNLPDLPVKCILQNPLSPRELIIGTELGIWITPDFKSSNIIWNQSYNGMRDVTVVDLDLRPSDNFVLATTHGRGMFTSNFTSNSLSISESEFEPSIIKLFPTITDGEVFIRSHKLVGEGQIEVYSLTGKKHYKMKAHISASSDLIVFDLPPGMYFVNIIVDNYMETKRIIVK